jgi:hypothetical protein
MHAYRRDTFIDRQDVVKSVLDDGLLVGQVVPPVANEILHRYGQILMGLIRVEFAFREKIAELVVPRRF